MISQRRGRLEGKHSLRLFSLGLLATVAIFILRSTPDERLVLQPVFVILAVVLILINVLFVRDGELPVFDAGAIFVLATAIYAIVPLLQFWASGLTFSAWSDWRLFSYQPLAHEIRGVAGWYVMLVATFAGTYMIFRSGGGEPMAPLRRPDQATGVAIFIALMVTFAYFVVLRLYVGPSVSVYAGGTGEEFKDLPYVFQQVSHIFDMARFTLKQFMVVFLVTRWERRGWRFVLVIWIMTEILVAALRMESRGPAVLLVITALVIYHRMVRPLRPSSAIVLALVMLGGFLTMGFLRDTGVASAERTEMLSVTNEFQGLFSNAFDLSMRRSYGTLPEVPPQMYFSDLYMLVPSQLLPFYKWNPSNWYGEVVMERGTGYMFGIVAQSIVGFGWPEMFVRAMLLGLFHAAAYRAYKRHASSFWATNLYLFILVWAYYAFRSTSFDILYKLAYYFLPSCGVVLLIRLLIVRRNVSARRSVS